MPNELQVDVIPPSPSDEGTETVDESLAADADKLLFAEMSTRDKVWALHYVHGWPAPKIGRALGMSRQAIHRHRMSIEDELEQSESGPQVAKRRSILRERLEAQYSRAMDVKDKERSVVLALKTLEVMAKLDGLNLDTQDASQKLVPYTPPEDIAADVQAVILQRWNRPALNDKDQATRGA